MNLLIVSSSLNRRSYSRRLGKRLLEIVSEWEECQLIDLRDYSIPFCDGGEAYADPTVHRLIEMIEGADGIVIASPIYNYDLNAAMKNLLELTGRAWSEKVVGLLCVAGGRGSYMAGLSFLNSLILDFRTYLIPRFVFASDLSIDEGEKLDGELDRRIAELGAEWVRVTRALKKG